MIHSNLKQQCSKYVNNVVLRKLTKGTFRFKSIIFLNMHTFNIHFLNLLRLLADTRVNHTGVLAVGTYLGFSLAVGIFTFVVNSLYGFNYVKIE